MVRGFSEAVRRWPVTASVLLMAIVSLPFVAFPEIDLAASRPLHVPGGFLLVHAHTLDIPRFAVRVLMIAAILWMLASLLVPLLMTSRRRRLMPPRAALFLLASLALGPGLMVGWFKDFWGRARPRELQGWGGQLEFSGAWETSSQCVSNCSFISGEAAAGMWLMALVLVVPPRWRLHVALGAFALAVLASAMRMMVGAHFLSDVLIAWCVTLTVIAVCHGIFYRWFGLTDESVDAWFSRARGFLQAPFRLVFGKN